MDEWRRSKFERDRLQQEAPAAPRSMHNMGPTASVLEADKQEDIQHAMKLSMAQAQAEDSTIAQTIANDQVAASSPQAQPDQTSEQMWKQTVGENEIAFQQALIDSMTIQQDERNSAAQENCCIPLPGTSEWAAACSAPPQEQVAAVTEINKMFDQEKAEKVKKIKDKARQSLLKAAEEGRLKPAFANVLQASDAELEKEEEALQSSGCGDGNESLAGAADAFQEKATLADPESPSRHGLVRCGA
jgi:hypothetical protein